MNTVTKNTIELVPFPHHEWPEGIPPSEQQVTMYRSDATYRENVHRLVQLLKDGATVTKFRKHPHPGLRKLGNWFKERRDSLERVAHRGNSPELDVWPTIAWHMGPCPLQGHRASVHRVDDLMGYRLGNLEWASKAVQALEKADGTCKILWQGKYISDRQLVYELKAIGIKCTENRIWQFRKYHQGKYPDLDTLHKAMLQKWGAYEASTATPTALVPDFLGEASIEKGILPRAEWERYIKAHAKVRLPPLKVQLKVVKELETHLLAQLSKKENGYTHRLEQQLQEVRDFYRRVRNRVDDLETKKSAFLADLIKIDLKEEEFHLHPPGFHHQPAPEPVPPAPPAQTTPPEPPQITFTGQAEIHAALWHLDGIYPTYEEALEAYHVGAHTKG